MDVTRLHLFLAIALVIASAGFDLRTRRIPNWLTLAALPIGPIWHGVSGASHDRATALSWLGASLLGILVCSIFPAISFAKREMGGGDVKLFAALGALCGPWVGFDAQAFTFLLTLTVVLPIRLIQRRLATNSLSLTAEQVTPALGSGVSAAALRAPRLESIPLAPWIALGLALSLWRNGMFT
jgi:prepilin peptidase CpaA